MDIKIDKVITDLLNSSYFHIGVIQDIPKETTESMKAVSLNALEVIESKIGRIIIKRYYTQEMFDSLDDYSKELYLERSVGDTAFITSD